MTRERKESAMIDVAILMVLIFNTALLALIVNRGAAQMPLRGHQTPSEARFSGLQIPDTRKMQTLLREREKVRRIGLRRKEYEKNGQHHA